MKKIKRGMIVTDTETTGLLAPSPASIHAQPFMTEIYCRKVDIKTFETIDEFESLVKPKIPIPEFITKITGISDETVKDAPDFSEIYDDLYDFFLGSEAALGQNILFDLTVARHELSRIGKEFNFPWPRDLYDTVEMSFPIMNRRMKLGELHEYLFGYKFENAHRARSDVDATLKCFIELRKRGF